MGIYFCKCKALVLNVKYICPLYYFTFCPYKKSCKQFKLVHCFDIFFFPNGTQVQSQIIVSRKRSFINVCSTMFCHILESFWIFWSSECVPLKKNTGLLCLRKISWLIWPGYRDFWNLSLLDDSQYEIIFSTVGRHPNSRVAVPTFIGFHEIQVS